LHGVGGTVGQRLTLLGNDADGVMNAVDTTLVGQLAAVTGGEKKLVLVPLSVGQGLVRMPGRATEIAVGVVDRKRVDDVTARLRTALGAGFEVTPWTELAPFARDAVMEQDLALNIITAVFLVVILLGVANAMLTSVLERVREIGTMMAVGTTRRQVLTLFTLEAAMLGILGGVLGCLVGSAVVAVLALHGVTLTTPGASLPQHLVPFIELSFLVKMVVLCGVGASFAALWPAWKASRLHPASALASV
jgi:putative ABC transport system permease protein